MLSSQQTYFKQHDVTTSDIKLKYTSRAAILYKDKLAQQANAALKSYPGSIHLESGHSNVEASEDATKNSSKTQSDFFTQIESSHSTGSSEVSDIHISAILTSNTEPLEPQQSFAVPGSTSLSATVGETPAPAPKKVSSLGSKKPVSKLVCCP